MNWKLHLKLLRATLAGKYVTVSMYEHRYLCPHCINGDRFELWSNDWSALTKLIEIHEEAHTLNAREQIQPVPDEPQKTKTVEVLQARRAEDDREKS
jgi:hypothetical protein